MWAPNAIQRQAITAASGGLYSIIDRRDDGGMTKAERIQKYRDEAKRLREAAKRYSAPDARKQAEEIAVQYETLAHTLEIAEMTGRAS